MKNQRIQRKLNFVQPVSSEFKVNEWNEIHACQLICHTYEYVHDYCIGVYATTIVIPRCPISFFVCMRNLYGDVKTP